MAAGTDVRIISLLVWSFFLGLLTSIKAHEVVILDTQRYDTLDWETYSKPGTRSRGWREASYNKNGDVYRVYTVCDVAQPNVSNWLRTPYIERGQANRLYIEMKFTMRKCTKYPDPGRLQQCKETFHLLYYEAESDFANSMMPTWDVYTYRHVDTIASDHMFTDVNNAIINTETRSIPITMKGVYFAFQDSGACSTLISIKVYYITCPSIVLNYAVFPNTTTGPEVTSIVQRTGTCIQNAAIERLPSYLCRGDGTWYYLTGGCKCMSGFQPQDKVKCLKCPIGTYKWKVGDHSCRLCPEHSTAPNEGHVECACDKGYYRDPRNEEEKGWPCTKPPSAPRNLSVTAFDQSTIILAWLPPLELGGRDDLKYRVVCKDCSVMVQYNPMRSGFNTTRVTLMGLTPSRTYDIEIHAENGVTDISQITRSIAISVTTESPIPSSVQNDRVVSVTARSITLAWDKPIDPNVEVMHYEVRKYPRHFPENVTTVLTSKLNYTFKDLELKTEYIFRVRVKTQKGWSDYTSPISVTTGNSLDGQGNIRPLDQKEGNIGIIAGSIVAVVVCMMIVIIMVVIFLRRNHRACNEKNVSDCDTLQYSNGEVTVPLFSPPVAIRTYVDPHTYEDPNQAVREFTKEIDASHITIESVIGGGEFGDVCKGKLRIPGKLEMIVAIKTLKAGASDKNRLDFLTEASIMGQFDDPNVIYLEGVVTKSNPIMIVTEYMANGSLDTFLRNNDGKFTDIQLVGMMRGIASGMKYLAEMGYVHRDLAARNILVNENYICKVADFGLSREIESDNTDGAYTTKGGKIPVRWTAPEAIAYRKFTSASDVWSYGVVMWEVMSYGERPYWNWSNQDVIKAVEKSYRLPPPMDCPEAIYQLMLDCWQKERSHRPKFPAIVKTLDKLIRAPELLRKKAKPRQHNICDPNMPDMTRFTSIEEWLTSIKMERYIEHFLQAGYCTMDDVSRLTAQELVNMSITLIGHQKKIMNSVQTLRAQIAGAQVSEGFLV